MRTFTEQDWDRYMYRIMPDSSHYKDDPRATAFYSFSRLMYFLEVIGPNWWEIDYGWDLMEKGRERYSNI